jgi:hypothetical protein
LNSYQQKNESLIAFKTKELRNDNNNFAGAVRGSGKTINVTAVEEVDFTSLAAVK